MGYFEGCFCTTCGVGCSDSYLRTFKYYLDEEAWIEITNENEKEYRREYHGGLVYNGIYYLFSGGYSGWYETILKLDLMSGDYLWPESENMPLISRRNYGLALVGKNAFIIEDLTMHIFHSQMKSIQ